MNAVEDADRADRPFSGPAGAQMTDDELVRGIRAGNGAYFETVMRRYNQRLFRVARAIVRDDDEAEDVIQQAYVNAYLHLVSLPSGPGFRHVGLNEDTVKTRLHRARVQLRRELTAEVGPSAATAFQFRGHRCDRVVAAVMARLAELGVSGDRNGSVP